MKDGKSEGSVGERVVTGTLWLGAWGWAEVLMGLVNTIVLARLLLPEDFGIVAMAGLVVVFFDVLIDLGTDRYLIRLPDPEREDYDTGWTLRLIVIAAASVMIFLVAVPAAGYFNDDRLVNVLQVLALASLLRGFDNIGFTLYRRDIQFRKVALAGAGQRLIGFIVTVTLAVLFHSYWAIVLGVVASCIAGLVLSYLMHPYRPRFAISRLARQWQFSKWLVVKNIARFLQGRGDQLVVAKFYGTEQIGLYSMATRFAELPIRYLMAPVMPPVYTGLAKKRHEPTQFTRSVLHVIGATCAVVLPTATLLAALSEPLIITVLGTNWQSTAPLIAPMVYTIVLLALTEPASITLTLLGRVRLEATLQWASGITIIGVMLVVAQFGDIVQLAWVRVAIAGLFLFLYYGYIRSALAVSWYRLLECIYRPCVASLAMWAVSTSVVAAFHGPWEKMVFVSLAGVGAYVITLYVLWRAASPPDSGEGLLGRQCAILFGRVYKRFRK